MNNHGGKRKGAGRKKLDRTKAITIMLTEPNYNKLERLAKNKTEYINKLIEKQPE